MIILSKLPAEARRFRYDDSHPSYILNEVKQEHMFHEAN